MYKSTNTATAAVTVKPHQCVSEFPGENLVVFCGKLFCQVCREELNVKKSSVKTHVQSTKHQVGKSKLEVKHKCEEDIAL